MVKFITIYGIASIIALVISFFAAPYKKRSRDLWMGLSFALPPAAMFLLLMGPAKVPHDPEAKRRKELQKMMDYGAG